MQELRAELLKSDDWEVLVAHYLGVDHAGHTFSVDSPAMLRKVAQMDAEITEVRPPPASHPHLLPHRLSDSHPHLLPHLPPASYPHLLLRYSLDSQTGYFPD